MSFAGVRRIATQAGLPPVRESSFPFPRRFGRRFKSNEFISVSQKAL
jgi:hypothetical protein